jgi:hypothetical protein
MRLALYIECSKNCADRITQMCDVFACTKSTDALSYMTDEIIKFTVTISWKSKQMKKLQFIAGIT